MPHFFISSSDKKQDIITISDKENFHHIARVLRAKIGETLVLIDENQTQYKVIVENISKNAITTKVVESTKSNHKLNLRLFLAQSVLKTDAQNFVIQKATELGVKGIYPLLTDNTVVKPAVIDAKIEKWNKYALEAVKQCERTDIPAVFGRTTIIQLLESGEFASVIACVERSQDETLKKALKNVKNEGKILVIIGPEGGFSKEETELLKNYEIHRVSLGKLILRAETAAISALSNIIYELEDE